MTHRRFLLLSVPAYLALFAIHLRNSLEPLLQGRVPPDLGYGAEASPFLQFLQIACVGYLFVVYGRMLLSWRHGQITARELAPTLAVVAVAAWTLLPANSSDILEYLGFGRLFGLYHINPYAYTYSEVTDWFSTYVTWDDPMPYGPPILPLFTLAGIVSAWHVLAGIYTLKLVWLAVHAVNTWLVYRIARQLTNDAALAAFAFGCNPLILFELVGNGHNDAVLILCGLGAVAFIQERRPVGALLCAFTGAVVKIAGIFWVVAIVALLIRQRRWRAIVWGGVACAIVVLGVALWPGCLDALTLLNSQWHYSEDSLHSVVINRLVSVWSHVAGGWDYDDVFQVDRLIATPAFLAFVVWRSWRIRDAGSLVRESGHIFLALLLGYAVSVGPWYFTWLVPMAVLADSARLRRTAFVAGASALVLYAFPFGLVEPVRLHEGVAAFRLAAAFGTPIIFFAVYPLAVRTYQLLRGRDVLPMPSTVADQA